VFRVLSDATSCRKHSTGCILAKSEGTLIACSRDALRVVVNGHVDPQTLVGVDRQLTAGTHDDEIPTLR
jgi:hypothetical protein